MLWSTWSFVFQAVPCRAVQCRAVPCAMLHCEECAPASRSSLARSALQKKPPIATPSMTSLWIGTMPCCNLKIALPRTVKLETSVTRSVKTATMRFTCLQSGACQICTWLGTCILIPPHTLLYWTHAHTLAAMSRPGCVCECMAMDVVFDIDLIHVYTHVCTLFGTLVHFSDH